MRHYFSNRKDVGQVEVLLIDELDIQVHVIGYMHDLIVGSFHMVLFRNEGNLLLHF